jgi:hypothetical protein
MYSKLKLFRLNYIQLLMWYHTSDCSTCRFEVLAVVGTTVRKMAMRNQRLGSASFYIKWSPEPSRQFEDWYAAIRLYSLTDWVKWLCSWWCSTVGWTADAVGTVAEGNSIVERRWHMYTQYRKCVRSTWERIRDVVPVKPSNLVDQIVPDGVTTSRLYRARCRWNCRRKWQNLLLSPMTTLSHKCMVPEHIKYNHSSQAWNVFEDW